jgi:GT2 family glycosyltransferase
VPVAINDDRRGAQPRVSVVIATRDRRADLGRTLRMLDPAATPVIVVDNASSDGTAEAVRAEHPDVEVLVQPTNLGGTGARNVGVRAARTRYVAFSDDDSWWAVGALDHAADVLDAHPRIALLAARTLVGAEQRDDPMNAALAASPLGGRSDGPGPHVMGFLACAAVARRAAFLAVGGFSELLFHIGEEQLLAIDLASAGWDLVYVDTVVSHHHPSPARPPGVDRRRRELRSSMLTALLRRPLTRALREAGALAGRALGDPAARAAVGNVLADLPAVARSRRPAPATVEARLRALEREQR